MENLQRPDYLIKELPIIGMSKANAKLLLKVYPLPYYINTNKYRAGWLAEWLKPHWACWRPWVQSSEWQ